MPPAAWGHAILPCSYDLKQLFIGSEGTLGIITAVSLLCPPRPTSVNVAYLACPSFEAAQVGGWASGWVGGEAGTVHLVLSACLLHHPACYPAWQAPEAPSTLPARSLRQQCPRHVWQHRPQQHPQHRPRHPPCRLLAMRPACADACEAAPRLPPVQAVFVRAKQALGEVLSAFEFLDRASLEVTLEHLPGSKDPLPGSEAPFYLVVETSGSNAEHDAAKLEAFLGGWMGGG